MDDGPDRGWRERLAAFLTGPAAPIASAVVVHVALALGTDLSPDEAYYLCAARQPGALPPIVDHPPLLPWLLRASDRIPGLPVELRVRVWPILLSALLGVACVALARRRGADRAGRTACAWAATWTLVPMAGGFVATPDAVLMLGAVAALVWADGAKRHLEDLSLGLVVAVSALAKVAAIPVALFAAAGSRRSPVARAAWLLPVAACLPLLVPSLRFQLGHAYGAGGGAPAVGGGAPEVGPLAALGALVAGQALLWSPWLMVEGTRSLPAAPRSDVAMVLGWTLLLVASAVVRGVPPEANWWAPAAIVVVVAACASARLSPRRRWAMIGVAVAPTLVAVVHTLHPILPLARTIDPTARLHGWRDGATAPLDAPGIGAYGPAAERCVYSGSCDEISMYFESMRSNH